MDTEHPTDPATGGDEKNQSIANTTSVDPPALKRQRAVASTDDDEEDAPRALHTNDVVTPMLNGKTIADCILEAILDANEVSVKQLAVSTGNITCTNGGIEATSIAINTTSNNGLQLFADGENFGGLGRYKPAPSTEGRTYLTLAAGGYWENASPDPRGAGQNWALRTDGSQTCIAGGTVNLRILGYGEEGEDTRRLKINWDAAIFQGLTTHTLTGTKRYLVNDAGSYAHVSNADGAIDATKPYTAVSPGTVYMSHRDDDHSPVTFPALAGTSTPTVP